MVAPEEAAHPAAEVPVSALLEVVQELRRALLARGEFLPPAWVEEASRDLHDGRIPGWCVGPRSGPTGVAFYSLRPHRAYGHLHVEPGPAAPERAESLAAALLGALPPAIGRMDIGSTGLSDEEEARLGSALAARPGMSAVRRFALERAARPESPDVPVPVPPGIRLRPIREIPLDTLATLDWNSFRGTADESLVADSPEEDRRILEEILAGELGRFLEEASTGLADEGGRFLGFVLAAEQSPRRAVLLDLVVHPAWRRRGLGEFLLRWAMRALFALGYEDVRLWVTAANDSARRLYDRSGFRPTLAATIYRFERPRADPPQPHAGA